MLYVLSTTRMGPGTARPSGKHGEAVEFVALASDGCLELIRGTITDISTKGRVLLRSDRFPDRLRLPLDCLAAAQGAELRA
jgi:hypothetical protein